VSPELGFVLLQEVLEEGAEAEYGLGMGGDLQAIHRRSVFLSRKDVIKENQSLSLD
jgi:hypothetical protein